ncbi:MAG: pyridoxal phosphate-dependent aminotransferase [Thermoanaerobaculia bacterium]
MFSHRIPAPSGTNLLTEALAARTESYIDLTVSNPTTVSLPAADDTGWNALAAAPARVYAPDPKGLRTSRQAVSDYYARHGVAANPERILLTASSSEAYGWLFKLLADPGDAILVPAPSYPLLDALAELEALELHRYSLSMEDGWALHASAIEAALDRLDLAGKRVAAVVLVNPNNPTGGSIAQAELKALLRLSHERNFGVISDEVFLDYRFESSAEDVAVAASESEGLVFSLGGLSKAAALPQLKLGWILANGPEPHLSQALSRLEWIGDAYLSVGTPVQQALAQLLEASDATAQRIRERIACNRAALDAAFSAGGAVSVQRMTGGWSAVLRLPAVMTEERLVIMLLERHDVLVHPGYFFEFPFEAFLVLSLLPEPGEFARGIARLAAALGALVPA